MVVPEQLLDHHQEMELIHIVQTVATHILVHHLPQRDTLQMVEVEHSHQEEVEPLELNHLNIKMLLRDLMLLMVLDYLVDLVVEPVKKLVPLVVHRHKIR